MKFTFSILLMFFLSSYPVFSQYSNKAGTDKYTDGEIILKIKPEYKNSCFREGTSLPEINYVLEKFRYSDMRQKFPNSITPRSGSKRETDISTIFSVYFDDNSLLEEVIQELIALPQIEYAQLNYIPELLYEPNDPLISSQWHLNNIKAYDAWDTCKGSSNVIIGITDTGTDFGHFDLVDNIAYNFDDPVNGIDDDHDGFTDNFRGWDMGDNDNSAQWSEANNPGAINHGVYVSGFAACKTDNGIGTASPGFLTTFLPVKISDANGMLVASYEGIVYAADHGCRIINCSWGGITPHPFGQDIINYATFNRNSLVIAAAGNNGQPQAPNDVYFPCAYDNVICVAASNSADVKWYKSCYGYQVDVTAPGESVYGTGPDNSYQSCWGTSFASPIAASVAALILAYHNDTLSALQIGQILRLSCDNIDTISDNVQYTGKLGKGRINAYNALALPPTPALQFENITFTESTTSDSAYINGELWNYLYPAGNINITLSCTNIFIEIVQNSILVDTIGYNTYVSFTSPPFSIRVLPGIPYDETVEFKIQIVTGTYIEDKYFNVTLNSSYYDFNSNDLKLTICSNGRYGHNRFSPLQGSGVRYKDSRNVLSDGGLMVAYSPTKSISSVFYRFDFAVMDPVHQVTSTVADFEFVSGYDDSSAPAGLQNLLQVNQKVYAWDNPASRNFVIVNYTLYNNNTLPVNNAYMGLFSDWDIVNPAMNLAYYESNRKLTIVKYQGITTLFAGILPLSDMQSNLYAIDTSDGIDITDYFSPEEIYQSFTEERLSAGFPNGLDVSTVNGYGPFNILPSDSASFAYAIIAAESEYLLYEAADTALSYYLQFLNNINTVSADESKISISPNPASDKILINISGKLSENFQINICDIRGVPVFSALASEKSSVIDINRLKPGVYIVSVTNANSRLHSRVCIE